MATQTLTPGGTLTAITYSQSPLVLLPADLATVAQMIKDDGNVAHPMVLDAMNYRGILSIPRRFAGLRVLPGDVVAVDSSGWPILISANAIAAGAWTLA